MEIHSRNGERRRICQHARDVGLKARTWCFSDQYPTQASLMIRTMPSIESSPTVSQSSPSATTDEEEVKILVGDLYGIATLYPPDIDWGAVHDKLVGIKKGPD